MKIDFYKLPKKKVINYFNSNEKNGLLNEQIYNSKKKYGENKLHIEEDLNFIYFYFQQIKSFLNLLLIFLVAFASIVWIKTKNIEYLMDAIIILLIFLINTIIGAYQNYSSRKIAKTLNSMLISNVIVNRNGEEKEINAEELVCGDIIILKGGDRVPADCYILESEDLKVDESLLTGESLPVSKSTQIPRNSKILSDITNMIFMNTYIISGNVKAIVVNVGMNTQMGKIANNLNKNKKKISFIDEIDEASKTISKFAIVLIIFVSLILYLKGFDIIEIFLVGSALIIGSVPEGLPAIVVFLLSKSIHNLSKKKILVKEMGLLETLGSINILCTDKTGTLTTNMMSVKKGFFNFEEIRSINKINNKNLKDDILKVISLANEAEFVINKFEGEAEDIALINFANKDNIINIRKKSKISFFEPFSSENKFVYAKLNNGIIYKKGAIEVILNECNYTYKKSSLIKLNSKIKEEIILKSREFTNEALRIIALSVLDKNKKIFLGFFGLYDKPKEGVFNTIKTLYNSNIDVKMITGDNINTAIAIAKECGFKNPKGVEYSQIKDLPKEEFEKVILNNNVFARVMPEFKEKIVEVLQKHNNRVAITGDGVNDSIALKNANVGIVMGSGSDLAKESGDLILINNNFNSIPLAIKEGRGIFVNIRKVINYLLTANLAEVLTIFAASFLNIIPFTAIQILWVNFVTDVFPALSLGVDKYPKDILKRKPTGIKEKILNNKIKLLTLFISIKKVILILLVFYFAYNYSNKNLVFAQTAAFTWLVLTHFIRIAAIRFEEKASLFKNKYVVNSIIFVIIVQILIIYTPLKKIFNVVELPATIWIVLIIALFVGITLAKIISKLVNYLVFKYFNDEKN